MVIKGKIKTGEYFDSVTLMIVGKEVSAAKGVIDAAVVMGTKENKSILKASGLMLPEFERSNDTDLLIAVNAEDGKNIDDVFKFVDELLKKSREKGGNDEEFTPKSIEGALKALPGANVALISVAGKYAGMEAEKALDNGLHVMLFSDNVSIETELALKKKGASKGLLVMGPDCGTAIINGAPLAFANVVNRGDIGIVAASGTGLQEVSVLISNNGCGVSQAIGTGGRDVKKDIGGIMVIEGLRALIEDVNTKVICLVSKPPHKDVLAKIIDVVKGTRKPVVAIFLGAEPGFGNGALHETMTLEEAALTAVAISKGGDPKAVSAMLKERSNENKALAGELAKRLKKGQKYIRGLFSGGTFCSEAQIIFNGKISNIHSNAPAGGASKLENSLKSVANTMVDLGEDEFTVGRPHPMIDFSLRNKRILEEAVDPETAVILLDVVLGYGSNMDPVAEIAPVIEKACKNTVVVTSVTGTDRDPQRRAAVEKGLKEAGAIVMPSNAAACELALAVVGY